MTENTKYALFLEDEDSISIQIHSDQSSNFTKEGLCIPFEDSRSIETIIKDFKANFECKNVLDVEQNFASLTYSQQYKTLLENAFMSYFFTTRQNKTENFTAF